MLGKGFALAMLAAAAVCAAVESRAADEFKYEEGYEVLFNGKDLTGWVYKSAPKESLAGKTETPDKRFQIKDGFIVANAKDENGKGGIKDLYTTKTFDKDFNLKLEFRAAPKADSGVYIRGPQLQVRDYPRAGPYKPKGFKDGDWNELDITVTGPVYFAQVNGKTVSPKDTLELLVKDGKPEAKLNGQPVALGTVQVSGGDGALCKCNGEVIEQAMKVPSKGGIGLQAESGKFEFRRIRVKMLK